MRTKSTASQPRRGARAQSSRTPCTVTRAISVTVVSAPTIVIARPSDFVQRPGAVLAARPGDQRLRLVHASTPRALARARTAAGRTSAAASGLVAEHRAAQRRRHARPTPRRRRPYPTASRARLRRVEQAVAQRLHQDAPRRLAADRRGRERADTQRRECPLRRMRLPSPSSRRRRTASRAIPSRKRSSRASLGRRARGRTSPPTST